MKQFDLTGIKRGKLTKGEMNDFRSKGYVPAILYGETLEENINIFCFINDLRGLIFTNEEYVVNLNIEGKTHKAIVKHIQYDPVSDLAIHIDFMEVYDEKVVKIQYPMNFQGTPAGAMEGGKVFRKLRRIRLKGKVKDMPDSLDIDISNMNLGDTLKIGDLSIPEVEILLQSTTPVVTVSRPRVAAEPETVLVEGEEGEEGEEAEGAEKEDGEAPGEAEAPAES